MILAVLLAGFGDYVFRYRELPLRWISFAAVACVALWAWIRFVLPALTERWSEGEVAQLIERGLPELRGQLSSAVETKVWCAGSLRKRCSRLECMAELTPARLWPVLQEVLLSWHVHSRSA